MTIRLLALDVDGTLTDGGVYMNGQGAEFKRFDIRDGMGIVRLRKAGVEIALISGRHSAVTEQRARDLGIIRLCNGVADKMPVLAALVEELGITFDETAYMGDDLNDLEVMKIVGLVGAPSDACAEVLEEADFISSKKGGEGAVREFLEYILKKEGSWDKIVPSN